MCRRITCRTCGKATWAGCGNHVEQALAGVPRSERCTCPQTGSRPASGNSWLTRLLGR